MPDIERFLAFFVYLQKIYEVFKRMNSSELVEWDEDAYNEGYNEGWNDAIEAAESKAGDLFREIGRLKIINFF